MRIRNWLFLLFLTGIMVSVASATTVYSSWQAGSSSGVNTRVYSGSGTNNTADWTSNGDGDTTYSSSFTGVGSISAGSNPQVLATWQASSGNSGAEVLQWDGTGWASQSTAWTWNAGVGYGYTGVGAGNLDNNGKLDALTTFTQSNGKSSLAWKELDGGAWTGVSGNITHFERSYLVWTGVGIGDLDGDGNPDIVVSWQHNTSGNSGVSTSEYTNGSWSAVTDLFTWNGGVGYGYTGVTIGDLDGDDNPDILATWKASSGNTAIGWKEYVDGSISSRGDVAGSTWNSGSSPGRTGVTFEIPEPATLTLLAAGGMGILVRRKK